VDKEIIYGKNALKTNYILNQRPDVPADGNLHWEDTFELPEGWRLVPDAEKGHRTTAPPHHRRLVAG
jgi:hypothetical protein